MSSTLMQYFPINVCIDEEGLFYSTPSYNLVLPYFPGLEVETRIRYRPFHGPPAQACTCVCVCCAGVVSGRPGWMLRARGGRID